MVFEHWWNDNDRGKLRWIKTPRIRIKWDEEPSRYADFFFLWPPLAV